VLAVCADESDDENSIAAAQKAEQLQAQQHAQQRQQHLRQQQLQQQAQSAAAAVFGSEPTITVNMRGRPAAAAAAAAAAAYTSEPTVTVNTRAALESMNQMFGSDMATMTLPRDAIASAAGAGHALAGGRAASRRQGGFGSSYSAADPTVTINTRAALDAMNGMFGGGDDTTTMHGFSQHGNRGHAAAGGAGARYGSSFSGGMQQPGGSSSGTEPTVTINTRAAFDAMNDMFGDMTGQQTLTGRQMGMAHGRVSGRGRCVDACEKAGWLPRLATVPA
jgi:hypothetical protein